MSKYICGLCCMEFLGSENICANLNKFSHIFPFKLQRGSQAQRVSLNEWELNGKLAHQNTSQLPNNRKRPCKLGPLLAKLCFCSQRHILVLRLKTFLQQLNGHHCTNQPCTQQNRCFNCAKICPGCSISRSHDRWLINKAENIQLCVCVTRF